VNSTRRVLKGSLRLTELEESLGINQGSTIKVDADGGGQEGRMFWYSFVLQGSGQAGEFYMDSARADAEGGGQDRKKEGNDFTQSNRSPS
jgi:hypothetical protein